MGLISDNPCPNLEMDKKSPCRYKERRSLVKVTGMKVVLSTLCLFSVASGQYYKEVQSYQPAYPSYTPPPPVYYETYDTQVDYKEANQTKRCGILPSVHQQYGNDKSRVNFGQYPWQVGILDNYYNYLCGGVVLTPRHILTSSYCVEKLPEDQLRVRVGEYDLQSDKNYLEVFRNTELMVCKKHPWYNVPYEQNYNQEKYGKKAYQADQYSSYAVTILELSKDIDLDLLPHVEPVCLPEFYYLTKSYTDTYTGYSYGYNSQQNAGSSQGHESNKKNEEGANKDLNCWVVGYQNSPLEKFEVQQQQQQQYPQPSYGQSQSQGYNSYTPQYPSYYPSYEYSRTPRRAKVHKVEEYASYYPKQSESKYKTESWEADYYYDACHADVGSAIFCLVQDKYEDEVYRPAYPESYPPSYPAPTYSPPAYTPPAYTPPAYSPPAYSPPAYSPPAYPSPQYYESPKYKRAAPYTPPYTPPYAPSYQPPAYVPEPEYKAPIKTAEPLNEESRRAALFGIVQYPPECSSYNSNAEKKLTATPVEDILPWIKSVTHTPPSCSYSSYSY